MTDKEAAQELAVEALKIKRIREHAMGLDGYAGRIAMVSAQDIQTRFAAVGGYRLPCLATLRQWRSSYADLCHMLWRKAIKEIPAVVAGDNGENEMPMYEMTVAGSDTPRLVRAPTAAQASAVIVTAKAVTAERMDELLEQGVVIERAPVTPPTGTVDASDGDKAPAGDKADDKAPGGDAE